MQDSELPKRTRRRVKKHHLYNGIKFRSKFEATVAEHLDKLGLSWEYEPETFKYVPPPALYTPDFRIDYPDGTCRYIEAKGYFDSLARIKMLCIREQYPDLPISMHFQRDNTLAHKSKIRYGDWCKKNRLDYTVSNEELYKLKQDYESKSRRNTRTGRDTKKSSVGTEHTTKASKSST